MSLSFDTVLNYSRSIRFAAACLFLCAATGLGQRSDNWGGNISSLPALRNSETRSISAENPKGERGGGAKAVPDERSPASDLGTGWKVRPFVPVPRQTTITLADIAGPGVIQHIWMTVDNKAYRDFILRFYWDGETNPSIEVPLGDFFAAGHGLRYKVNSMMVAVNPTGGLNSYWPMPFRKSARITLENQSTQNFPQFFYQITYALEPVPENAAYFHAQWRRSLTSRKHPEHVIVDGIAGRGHYVGTFLAWEQLSNGWWGEGEIKFFMDGDRENPTICGTGTEDYFGGAWAFGDTYSTPFLGYPLQVREAEKVSKHSLYRWHVLDPIRFTKDLRVTIQALGWWPNGKFQPLTDDIASVAYWYQVEPHTPFPSLPERMARFPR
jgi:hypothetical protein